LGVGTNRRQAFSTIGSGLPRFGEPSQTDGLPATAPNLDAERSTRLGHELETSVRDVSGVVVDDTATSHAG
jgi:hypothetical protein